MKWDTALLEGGDLLATIVKFDNRTKTVVALKKVEVDMPVASFAGRILKAGIFNHAAAPTNSPK